MHDMVAAIEGAHAVGAASGLSPVHDRHRVPRRPDDVDSLEIEVDVGENSRKGNLRTLRLGLLYSA